MQDVGFYVHYYFFLADNPYLGMSNSSKFRKLCKISYMEVILPKVTYFYTQFKNHIIQILNGKQQAHSIIYWAKKFINDI
jgi:hypothetical protein